MGDFIILHTHAVYSSNDLKSSYSILTARRQPPQDEVVYDILYNIIINLGGLVWHDTLLTCRQS